jgi:hypothetical protein
MAGVPFHQLREIGLAFFESVRIQAIVVAPILQVVEMSHPFIFEVAQDDFTGSRGPIAGDWMSFDGVHVSLALPP